MEETTEIINNEITEINEEVMEAAPDWMENGAWICTGMGITILGIAAVYAGAKAIGKYVVPAAKNGITKLFKKKGSDIIDVTDTVEVVETKVEDNESE